MAMFIVKPWYRKKDDAIYGAEWAGTSDPSWVRTDDAVGFANPNPYYAGMSTTPSSPFDNIMPWSGIVKEERPCGTMVYLPKYYYKISKPNGIGLKIQVSMSQFDGSVVDPVHMDRGDGAGERNTAYTGRYACASDYKSKSGSQPKVYISLTDAYNGIHGLGSNIWEIDYTVMQYLRILFLVEFASWDIFSKIGYSYNDSRGLINTGYTDSMPYHTGTMQSSRATVGSGTQYRNIEGLFDNVQYFVNGITMKYSDVYACKNPTYQTNDNYYVKIGTTVITGASHLTILGYNLSDVQGYEYAMLPSNASGQSVDYTCAKMVAPSSSSFRAAVTGSNYTAANRDNMFAWDTWMARSNDSRSNIGCRLMELL